jgi:hypothetical protein
MEETRGASPVVLLPSLFILLLLSLLGDKHFGIGYAKNFLAYVCCLLNCLELGSF